MRADQTVSEMVVESLARQTEGMKQPFEESFAQVLKTPAGRRLAELADGPHRHEKAAEWQAGLLREREARRPAHLRSSEGGHEADEGGHDLWLGRYVERVEGTDALAEYQALLR